MRSAKTWRWNSIGARMTQVLVLTLIAPLAFAVHQAISAYQDNQRRELAAVDQTLAAIARYERDFFSATRSLLHRLADDAVIAEPQPGCSGRLEGAVTRNPAYLGIVVFDDRGRAVCASSGPLAAYLARTNPLADAFDDEATFALSEVIVVDSWGRPPILTAGVPTAVGDGGSGRLVLAIDLKVLLTAIRALDLPVASAAVLVDTEGHLVLQERARGAGQEGRLPDEAALRRIVTGSEASFELEGNDGTVRRYAATPVAAERLFIVTGVPVGGPRAWIDRDLLRAILAPVGLVVLAVLTIAVAAEWLVNRHVRTLADNLRRWMEGAPWPNERARPMPDELAVLSEGLGELVERVEERETRLRASIDEKEALLREVHHRVKNNLQLVTSLLSLRRRRAATPAADEAMQEAQMRIRALALLHRNLYQQDDIGAVDLPTFVDDLCGLVEEFDDRGAADIAIDVCVAPTALPIGRAIPVALFLVEALSNAYKHAFEAGARGSIRVTVGRVGANTVEVAVADDGRGMAVDAQDGGDTLGLTLLQMLAGEIGGRLRVDTERGTRVAVAFPLAAPKPHPKETRRGRGTQPRPHSLGSQVNH